MLYSCLDDTGHFHFKLVVLVPFQNLLYTYHSFIAPMLAARHIHWFIQSVCARSYSAELLSICCHFHCLYTFS